VTKDWAQELRALVVMEAFAIRYLQCQPRRGRKNPVTSSMNTKETGGCTNSLTNERGTGGGAAVDFGFALRRVCGKSLFWRRSGWGLVAELLRAPCRDGGRHTQLVAGDLEVQVTARKRRTRPRCLGRYFNQMRRSSLKASVKPLLETRARLKRRRRLFASGSARSFGVCGSGR